MPIRLVELRLEFHPMQTKGVQEALQHIHAQQDPSGGARPHSKTEVDGDTAHDALHGHRRQQKLIQEHQCQLLMGQRQRPGSKVGSGVRHCAEHVFNRLDCLVDSNFAHIECLDVLAVALPEMSATHQPANLFVVHSHLLIALSHALVLPPQDQRLGDQDQRHGEHCEGHQQLLDTSLPLVQWGLVGSSQPHGDHSVNDRWRVVHWRHPLVHDHVVHVPKEANHEHCHGHAFEDEIHPVTGVACVDKPHGQAQHHLRYTEQHSELHLQRIHEQELIVCPVPSGVKAEWIGLAAPLHCPGGLALRQGRLRVAGVEQRNSDTHHLAVHQPCVYGEETHQGQHVPQGVEGLQHRVVLQPIRVQHAPAAKQEQAQAMPDITEHDSEDKWKGNNSKKRWVYLLVPGDPVGIHERLESIDQCIGLIVSWCRCCIDGARVQDEHARNASGLGALQQRAADAAFLGVRVPAISPKSGLSLKHVQHSVNCPLLEGKQPPLLNTRISIGARHLSQGSKLVGQESVIGLQGLGLLSNLHFQVCLSGGCCLVARWPIARPGAVRLTNPCHLLSHVTGCSALEIDHKDRLLNGISGFRVKQRFADRLEVRVGVTTGRPKQSPREALLLGLHDSASHSCKTEAIVPNKTVRLTGRPVGGAALLEMPALVLQGRQAHHPLLLDTLHFSLLQALVVVLKSAQPAVDLSDLFLHLVQGVDR
mmetsp:Transcript_19722/g.45295  ORF Transcript_19722/g.45295 Transcript_19722/m.45295 type:complete len:704 (-) Transcript_19722:342-2453(-)